MGIGKSSYGFDPSPLSRAYPPQNDILPCAWPYRVEKNHTNVGSPNGAGSRGSLLEMGYFRLKLGLRGGARQGPQQEPGPLLAHCTHRDVMGAIFMKMDNTRPKANQKRRKKPKCSEYLRSSLSSGEAVGRSLFVLPNDFIG
jgi:hypothetical protein